MPADLNAVCPLAARVSSLVSVVREDLVKVGSLVVNEHGDDAANVVMLTTPLTPIGHVVGLHADLEQLLGVGRGADHRGADFQHLQKYSFDYHFEKI